MCVTIFGDLSGGNYHIWVVAGVRDYIWGSEWYQVPLGSWLVCVTMFGDLSGAKYHVWVVAGPHDVFLVFCPVS